MICIDTDLDTPVFQQIVDQVVAAVRDGELVPGSRLGTVRQLALDLGVSPNTVAKAYRQLESEGHVETRGRLGTVVLGARAGGSAPVDDVVAAAQDLVRAARARGLDLSGTIGLLHQTW